MIPKLVIKIIKMCYNFLKVMRNPEFAQIYNCIVRWTFFHIYHQILFM